MKQVGTVLDTLGSYENNGAVQGGAIFLDQITSAKFDRVTFTNNWAQQGGTMYVQNQQTL